MFISIIIIENKKELNILIIINSDKFKSYFNQNYY
jgi:hypothetical protein